MPTPTEVTLEDSFQVLDSLDISPPGSNIEAYVEEAVTQLTMGQQVHSIVFAVQKASLNYHFDEEQVRNTTDATPRVLSWIITNKTVNGFEVTLSGTPDTGNYYFSWKVRIPTALTNNVIITAESAGSGGTVTRVDATASSGLTAVVTNATTAPTIAMDISNGGIPLAKLAQSVVVDDGTVTHNATAQTLTNKGIDGNNNTLSNIGVASLSGSGIIAQNLSDPGSDQIIIWDEIGANFRFAGTPSARGIGLDMFLALRTDGKSGTGAPEDPLDVSTQSKFDTVMANNTLIPANCHIWLKNGTFLTKGFPVLSGWKFHMTPASTLKLDVLTAGEVGALPASRVFAMFGKTTVPLVQDILIEGGTWDLNMQNQTQALCPSVVQTIADGFKFRDCKVINFGNTSPTNNECFVVGNFTNPGRDSLIHARGVVVENVEFTQIANGVTNTGTLSLCAPGTGQVSTNSIGVGWFYGVTVRNCFFHNINSGDAVGVDCINLGSAIQEFHGHGNRFVDVYGTTARYGYYWDTGAGIDFKIEDDQFYNVPIGVYISNSSSPAPTRKYITVSNCMMNGNSNIPILISDDTANGLHEVSVVDNRIFVPGAGGISVQKCDGVRVINNTIDASSNEVNVTGSTKVYRFGNRRPDSTAVTGERYVLATGAGHTVDDIITVLQNLQLCSQT